MKGVEQHRSSVDFIVAQHAASVTVDQTHDVTFGVVHHLRKAFLERQNGFLGVELKVARALRHDGADAAHVDVSREVGHDFPCCFNIILLVGLGPLDENDAVWGDESHPRRILCDFHLRDCEQTAVGGVEHGEGHCGVQNGLVVHELQHLGRLT
eukprot:CAMPEP_0116930284 /NCGR_PEP_ID=MMETSP0467-20121206/27107_1 /TAXON_ID=283647 /ORGANISM="Mesodinium pulex, Strain SPMC105" /LENGTH=153 /DNA_ID=CAMNT_0004610459 /DNA_START=222 /DNA_END=682 /DNA_ORIENTATION=-